MIQSKINYSEHYNFEKGDSIKTTKLKPFYCTKCGLYHDVLTLCPVFCDECNCCNKKIGCSHKHTKNECVCSNMITNIPSLRTSEQTLSKTLQAISKENCLLYGSKLENNEREIKEVQTVDDDFISKSSETVILDRASARLFGAGTNNTSILPLTDNEKEELLKSKTLANPTSVKGRILSRKIIKTIYRLDTVKQCELKYPRIPKSMGWLWNVEDTLNTKLKPRPDWRPGAMNFKIAQLIKRHKTQLLGNASQVTKRSARKMKDDDFYIRPMIVIMKKEKSYLITMNSIPNPYIDSDDENNENKEYDSVHFIIDRRKSKIQKIREICDCTCDCSNSTIEYKNYASDDEDESSSESEFEIEFTPPICLVDRETIKKKPVVAHVAIQTESEKKKRIKKKIK